MFVKKWVLEVKLIKTINHNSQRIYFLNLLTLLLIKSGAGETFQQNFPLEICIEQHKNVD